MTITTDIAAFGAGLAPNARLLGLDLGTKTIGIAMATLSVGIATPLFTIQRTKFQQDARTLIDLVTKERIGAIVLGLPFNMDGSEGPRAQSTRAFARNWQVHRPPPILLWDERLSSSDAEDSMIAAGMSPARRAALIDAGAARVILQDALYRLQMISRDD
jgi:putative holliday junction resolvase